MRDRRRAEKHRKPRRPTRKWSIDEILITKMAVPIRMAALPCIYDTFLAII